MLYVFQTQTLYLYNLDENDNKEYRLFDNLTQKIVSQS